MGGSGWGKSLRVNALGTCGSLNSPIYPGLHRQQDPPGATRSPWHQRHPTGYYPAGMVPRRIYTPYPRLDREMGTPHRRSAKRLGGQNHAHQMGHLQHRRQTHLVESGIGQKAGALPGIHHRA